MNFPPNSAAISQALVDSNSLIINGLVSFADVCNAGFSHTRMTNMWFSKCANTDNKAIGLLRLRL